MYKFKSTNDDININLFEFSEDIKKENLVSFQNDFDSIFNKKKPFFVIFNLLNISSFDMKFFITMLTYIHKNKTLVQQYLKASSIIVNDKYRSILNIGLKMKKPITPNFITSDLNQGIQFFINISNSNS